MTQCVPASDPLFYKLLAVVLCISSLTFLISYLVWAMKGRRLRSIEPFAWAMVGLATALVIYTIATLLRQVLGPDYGGRDLIRSAGSAMLSVAMLTISRVTYRNRPHR